MSDTKGNHKKSAKPVAEERSLPWEARVKLAREQREKVLARPQQNKTKQNKSDANTSVGPPETEEATTLPPPVFKSLKSSGSTQTDPSPEAPRRTGKSRIGSAIAILTAVVFGVFLYLENAGYLDDLRSTNETAPGQSIGENTGSLPDYGAAPALETEVPTDIQQWGQNLEFSSGDFATPVSFSHRAPSVRPRFLPWTKLPEPDGGAGPSPPRLDADVTSPAEKLRTIPREPDQSDATLSVPPTIEPPTAAQRAFSEQLESEPEERFSALQLVLKPEPLSWPRTSETGHAETASLEDMLVLGSDGRPEADPAPPVPKQQTPAIDAEWPPPDKPIQSISADISLFIPTRVPEAATIEAIEILTQRKSGGIETARVNYTVRQTQVRFYHPADADNAAKAAEALGGVSRDFTGSASKTQPGRIEIYLAGSGAGQRRQTDAETNGFEAFIQRLLQELR